jgi:hypothetical protein
MNLNKNTKLFLIAVGVIAIFVAGVGSGILYLKKINPQTSLLEENKENKYILFSKEVYDIIIESYWEDINDDQLVSSYVLGIEKIIGQPQNLKRNDKQNLFKNMDYLLSQIEDEEKKKQFVTQLADTVLVNLRPFGRSRLYTQKEEKALSDNVKNKAEEDLYGVLGIDKNATDDQIAKAFEKESKEWNPEENNSPEAQENYNKVQKAYEVLKEEDTKERYDTAGIEPTMEYKLITPEIFYLHITKFSPTTFDELQKVTQKVDQGNNLDTLILDLRNNIGGAIDGLPYFLGPFIGNDQYAYQFFHKGEKTDFKTKIGWLPSLVRYKKIVVLINENTQSSAEVMAATLKRFNVGVTLGKTTKGWGTVERVFPINNQLAEEEKYSIFLVHNITIDDNGQPIEGSGVVPAIEIESSNWKQQLLSYYEYPELVSAVEKVWREID